MTKEDIIECASELFFRYGTKAVNMDEIASTLGVSKRTLYETIGSKDELINACIKSSNARLKESLRRVEIIRDTRAALVAIFNLGIKAYENFYNFSPSFYKDMKNHSAANIMLEQEMAIIKDCTQQIYAKGVEEGLLKNADDFEMIYTTWQCYNKHNMHEEPANRIKPESFTKVLRVMIQSLATEEGQDLIRVIR